MVMTYRNALSEGNKILRESGIAEGTDARVLLCHVSGLDTLRLTVCGSEPIPGDVYERYMKCISRRALREPVSYITGVREFMGLDFAVEPGILIPRPETEHTVEYVIDLLKGKSAHILDLCTGSGAIAVSLAKYLPSCRVTAVDISDTAIAVSGKNAMSNGVADRVDIFKADVLEKPDFGMDFDAVVSNPPYIPDETVKTLDTDVRDFEPHLALCGGEDGLVFYRAITELAPTLLSNGGSLVYEVGHDQAEQVAELMKDNFESIGFIRDLAGINRVVHGTLKSEKK